MNASIEEIAWEAYRAGVGDHSCTDDELLSSFRAWWSTRDARPLVIRVTINGEPASKQRPRFAIGRGGRVYTPSSTKIAESVVGWTIKAAYRAIAPIQQGAFAVSIAFFTKDRHRRDLDNMCKLVFDACNGLVWRDDVQVEELFARVTRADEKPRTEIEVRSLPDSTPYVSCSICQRKVKTYPSWDRRRKFCSKKCQSEAYRNGIEVECAQCQKGIHRAEYQIASARTYFCSPECKSLYLTVELVCPGCEKPFRTPKSFSRRGKTCCSKACQARHARTLKLARPSRYRCACGKPISRKEYERCNACKLEAQAATQKEKP